MSIPYNRTQVISTALSILGYPLIQSIASGGAAAAALDNLYDPLLAADLSSPNWRFASKVAQLSRVAGVDPDFDWYDSEYQLPSDCLAVWQIFPNVPYEVFGERIWTVGTQPLKIQYRAMVPESMLPPAYLMYFCYLLADSAGPPIIQDANMASVIQAQMTKWRSQAMVANSQGRPNQGLTNSSWVSARTSGTYNGGGWA